MDNELFVMLRRHMPEAKIWAAVEDMSLGADRMKGIIRALEAGIDGDTAEIGCRTGRTSKLIALLNGGRRHWACDTFSGLADCIKEHDGTKFHNGSFASPRGVAEQALEGLENVQIVAGYFPNSTPAEMREAKFSVVHIDVDTYQSTKAAFTFFVSRLNTGGILVMDDVLYPGPRGALQAFAELLDQFPCEVIEENPPQSIVRLVHA